MQVEKMGKLGKLWVLGVFPDLLLKINKFFINKNAFVDETRRTPKKAFSNCSEEGFRGV